MSETRPKRRQRESVWAWLAAALWLLLAAAACVWPGALAHPWVLAAQLALALPLGSTIIQMTWLLTGGRWIHPLRPALDAFSHLAPASVLFFLPLICFPDLLLYWRDPSPENLDIAHERAIYANTPFLIMRGTIYLIVFLLLPWLVNRAVKRRLLNAGPSGRTTAAAGMLVLVLTVYFFTVDTVMALEPHWFSTMMPFALFITMALLAYVAACAFGIRLHQHPEETLRRTGNLLLALLCLWLYLSFMQFLIIWMGNLPVETPWYLKRAGNGWTWITVAIVAFGFMVPFALLLPLENRMSQRRIAQAAWLVLVGQLLYLSWLILPFSIFEGALTAIPVGLACAAVVLWLPARLARVAGRNIKPEESEL